MRRECEEFNFARQCGYDRRRAPGHRYSGSESASGVPYWLVMPLGVGISASLNSTAAERIIYVPSKIRCGVQVSFGGSVAG